MLEWRKREREKGRTDPCLLCTFHCIDRRSCDAFEHFDGRSLEGEDGGREGEGKGTFASITREGSVVLSRRSITADYAVLLYRRLNREREGHILLLDKHWRTLLIAGAESSELREGSSCLIFRPIPEERQKKRSTKGCWREKGSLRHTSYLTHTLHHCLFLRLS